MGSQWGRKGWEEWVQACGREEWEMRSSNGEGRDGRNGSRHVEGREKTREARLVEGRRCPGIRKGGGDPVGPDTLKKGRRRLPPFGKKKEKGPGLWQEKDAN
jgi:hypothetical protein